MRTRTVPKRRSGALPGAAAALSALVWLAGCSSGPAVEFHELALEQAQRPHADKRFDLPFDAYVIGIDKHSFWHTGRLSECAPGAPHERCLDVAAPYFGTRPRVAQDIRQHAFDQFKPSYVSHIASFAPGREACFVYNSFSASRACSTGTAAVDARARPVDAGWQALEGMQGELSARVQALKPTHIITFVMGWNTEQWEALQNFRELRLHLEAAAQERADTVFRPLYLGITWPSTGQPTIPGSDYPAKSGDADEIGMSWANVLLNRVLAPVKRATGVRVVVVGHSFGARMTSRAAFSAPLLGERIEPVVDLLIGLQGAYSFQRYVASEETGSPEGIEGAPYADFRRFVGKAVLTAARGDEAVKAAGHGPFFVGSSEVFERTKSASLAPLFEHRVAAADGSVATHGCDRSRLLYVDASAVIKVAQPHSMGGTHSDIFKPQIGRFIHQMIRDCAP